MAAIASILLQQIARVATTNPQAAMLLLPAPARAAVTALQTVPTLRQDLESQWMQLNNAIEADYSQASPAQVATITAQINAKRARLEAAQAAMNRVDSVLSSAAGVLIGLGFPAPGWPLMARSGVQGLGALPVVGGAIGVALIIVAAAIGASLVITALADAARELAAASRIFLGWDAAPPPRQGTIATLGIAGMLIAGVVLVAIMGRGRR